MLRITDLKLPLGHAPEALAAAVLGRLALTADEMLDFAVARRANDARRKSAIVMVYSVDVAVRDEAAVLARFAGDPHVRPTPDTRYRFACPVPMAPPAVRPVVVGTGPCGLFAALILAQMGLRPIVLDRGKMVRERTRDTWGLWRRGVLDPESNVQFGEGGAGTFSDGKLWSQVKDPRHLGRKVLTEFVTAGAPPEILTEAHPHIGTFRLVTMVEHMRATIEALGGEYRWGQRVDDLDVATDADGTRRIRGLQLSTGDHLAADHVVLAIGHSARDTFKMLHARGVHIEAKPFSIGVRIEHPQSWIDQARFGACAKHPDLGAAAYTLSHHCANDRTVYSFCMCPGGRVVAATSEPGRVVTNGMSQYSRAEFNANSGLVVGIDPRARLSRRPARRDRPAAPARGSRLRRGRVELCGTRPARRRFSGRPSLHRVRRGRAVLQAGRDADRSRGMPARLRGRRDPRGAARLRPPDRRLRPSRCDADRGRDAHLLADPHHPRARLPEPQHAPAVPGGRRCWLCRRDPVGGDRRHQGRRGGRAEHRGGRAGGSALGPEASRRSASLFRGRSICHARRTDRHSAVAGSLRPTKTSC